MLLSNITYLLGDRARPVKHFYIYEYNISNSNYTNSTKSSRSSSISNSSNISSCSSSYQHLCFSRRRYYYCYSYNKYFNHCINMPLFDGN